MTVQDLCNKLGELTFYVLAGSWPLVRRHARAEFDYFSPLLRALQGIFGVGKYVDFQLAVAQLRPLQAKTGGLTFDLDAMISGIDERAFSSQSAWTPEMFRWRVALRMPASVSEMNGGVTICAQNLIEEISASPNPDIQALLSTESNDYLRVYVKLAPALNKLVKSATLKALLPDVKSDDESGGAAAPK